MTTYRSYKDWLSLRPQRKDPNTGEPVWPLRIHEQRKVDQSMSKPDIHR